MADIPIGLGSFTETDVASAATCDIGAASTIKVRITGSVTITSFGPSTNRIRFIRFAAALTLTHNAVSLRLPTNASIAVEAGDTCFAMSTAGGNWVVVQYQRDTGVALVASALDADLAAIAALTTTSFGRGLLELANAAALRTAGGLVIGTNVQAWSTALDEWAAKARPAGQTVGTTDSQTLTNKTITFAGNTLTGVQEQSTALDEWALKARPGGATVGTSDTQTLTDKTLTSPVLSWASAAERRAVCAALGIWYQHAHSGVAIPSANLTSEQMLLTLPVAGGIIGANGRQLVTLQFRFNGTATKTFRGYYGGTGGMKFMESAATTHLSARQEHEIVNQANVALQVSNSPASSLGISGAAPVNGTIDSASSQDIVITVQKVTGTEVATLESYKHEILYGA